MDNKTFLETFLNYLSDYEDYEDNGIKIYHESSIYFYGYQIPQKFFSFCYIYWKDNLFVQFKLKKGNKTTVTTIIVDTSILNDFVTFKLKKKDDIWVFYAYRKEDIAVNTIKKYWKKYYWDYRKNLSAKLYHPSRLTFSV